MATRTPLLLNGFATELSVAAAAKCIIGAVLLSVSYILWTYRNRGLLSSSSRNAAWISGPVGQAFRGNTKELDTKGAASCHAWFSLYNRFGPAYEMTIPYFRIHVINHPSYLEHIQKTNSKNYIRGAFTRNVFEALHRTGIFVSDGKDWQMQRKAATRAFSKQNFETHITASLHHWLDILSRLLENLAKQNKSFDFQELMGRFMYCLFLKVAFHEEDLAAEVMTEDPNCLHSMPEYMTAFDQAQLLFDRRRRDPLWRLTERLSGENKISKRGVDLFYQRIDGLIDKRLRAMTNGYKPNPDAGVDLLDVFLQTTSDTYTLGGMIFSFLSAGRDTTAFSTSWMMKEIHHRDNAHLDAVSKIRKEVDNLGFEAKYLSYLETPRLKFANAMWDETSRLNTVSPAGQMEAAEDDVLPAVPELNMPPRHVKKGDIVAYQNYVMSRMPQIWGEDCAVFNPYRWFKEDGETISYSPFKYHSWNAGPRSCLGRALATYEGIAIVCAILSRFDVLLDDPVKKYDSLPALNMGIKDGLWMKVKPRKAL